MSKVFGRRPALAAAATGAVTLLIAGGGYAIASGGGSLHACAKKSNGALRLASKCRKSERPVVWNVQGARGLQGPRGQQGAQGGQGNAGPTGPSDAYSAFKDGPVDPLPSTMTTIATLPIPSPGNYVIFAKLVLHDDVNTGVDVACRLVAGGDIDHANTSLEGNTDGFVTDATVSLNVVHHFNAAGSAPLQCKGAGVHTDATWIKITAIHVGNLTNGASS